MVYLTGTVSVIVGILFCMVCTHDWKKIGKAGQEKWPGKKQAVLYIIMAVVSFLFAALFDQYGYGPLKSIKYGCFIWGLLPIAFRDWKTKIIPNRWLVYLIGIRGALFLTEWMFYPNAVWDNFLFLFLGAAVSGGIMFLAYVISRHEVGMGDVKLFIVMGMYLGLSLNYIVLLVSLIFSALYGGIKIIKKDLKSKDSIPFAPFVFLGTVVVLGLGF